MKPSLQYIKKLFQKRKKGPLASLHHDVSLVKRVHGRRLPKIKQFRQLKRILSKKERLIFRVSFLILLSGLVWGGLTLLGNFRTPVPAVGGRYVEAVVGSPQFINPIFSSVNDVDTDIVRLVYSGLMRFDEHQDLIPDLAESYEISEDKKTYTFKLRSDATWHDGEPFTSRDVVFTMDTIQNTQVGSPLFVSFQGVRVEAQDEQTVVFTLEEPFAPFLSSLTVGMLPEHIWFDVLPDRLRLAQKNLQPIGTGPFKYSKFKKDDTGYILSYELERFENYYRAPAFIEEFVFKFFTDYDDIGGAIQALREGAVDGIHFVPSDLREKVERKHVMLHTLQVPEYSALFYNQEKDEVLKEGGLRTALGYALDKDRILRESLGGEGEVIYSPILPGFPGYTPEIEKTSYSTVQANELLDKSWERIDAEEVKKKLRDRLIQEWKENNPTPAPVEGAEEGSVDETVAEGEASTETVEEAVTEEVELSEETNKDIEAQVAAMYHEAQVFYRKNGEDGILELDLVTSDTPEYKHAAELIAGFWQEVGVKTNVRFVPRRDFSREVLKERSYDVLLYGMIIGSSPDQYPFWHSSQIDFPGLNLARYVNRNVDALLEKAREKAGDDEEIELYKKFQDIVLEEKPATFLYTPTYSYVTTDKVSGIDIGRIFHPSDRYAQVTDWYIETKGEWKK
ncbi:MAG: ABC transporter substrate-binding protein [Candidatus Magasanikbacteria bacterium]